MDTATDNSEFIAILKLIEDPDPEIYSHIEEKVVNIGISAIPFLETAYKKSSDGLSNNRISTLLNKINFNKASIALQSWKNDSSQNLIDAAIILTEFHYPNYDETLIRDQIKKIKQDVWLELNEEFTALEKIHILNHVFFNIYNFKGNKTNLSHPQNSLIKDLIENKQGNSVILSILYLDIAQSLKLPVYGVNLPENFILAYLNFKHINSDSKPLFYINPFNEGTIFTKDDIEIFIKQLDLDYEKKFFEPCDNQSILRRLMAELINSYDLSGDFNKNNQLKKLYNLI